MYGVKDANGVELEEGDKVEVLYEEWPDYLDRVGTVGTVSLDPADLELVLVTFPNDGEEVYYVSENVAVVT